MEKFEEKNNITEDNVATILCCECGVGLDGTKGGIMCFDCIKIKYDLSKNVSKESSILFCRKCERYHQPPSLWIRAELESKELLGICLRKIRGLNKVRMVDAVFIWTESHSKRIKVRVTLQGEICMGQILQQDFECEIVVIATQCPDCARSFTPNTWRSLVQLRQKVEHKRTFLLIEQLILKHEAHQEATSIKECRDGLDFYFQLRNAALKMIEFLSSVAPIKTKKSEELIGSDIHLGVSTYKFTHSVEIAPICRDDLILLPKKLKNSLGFLSHLVLCRKVTSLIQLIDPLTLKTAELQSAHYWKNPFMSLCDSSRLTEFIVLNIDYTGVSDGKYVLADIELYREADLKNNAPSYYVRSHLGAILHPGDSCLGYFLSHENLNSDLWDSVDKTLIPNIILVKKLYDRTRSKKRLWKLKRLNAVSVPSTLDSSKKTRKDDLEQDYELFLREIEEDKELRQNVDLFWNKSKLDPSKSDDVDIDTFSPIAVDQLLDNLDDMALKND